ncbi:hypothetical protein MMC13_003176 [Lambiella insularis]|nr:hypothetical protein [Lambiella insularis]
MPPTIPLSEIPTLSILYKLKHLSPPPLSTSLPQPSQRFNDSICLIRTDITTLGVSAIVNAANTSLLGGGGVDGAIHSRAGPGLYDECLTLHGCETGSAKITSAYDLRCENVIHAVGPVYWKAKKEKAGLERQLLAGCYRKCLELAQQEGCKSVAFSAISTGVYGYPSGEAAEVALRTVKEWIEQKGDSRGGLEKVVFCVFERKDEVAYEEWLPKFFPPLEQNMESTKKHDDLIKAMPDPPKDDPLEEGQPGAKKQKVGIDTEEDWEAVEKPEYEADDGYGEDSMRDRSEMTADEQIELEEAKEERLNAMQTTEAGGVPPPGVNPLMKDW